MMTTNALHGAIARLFQILCHLCRRPMFSGKGKIGWWLYPPLFGGTNVLLVQRLQMQEV